MSGRPNQEITTDHNRSVRPHQNETTYDLFEHWTPNTCFLTPYDLFEHMCSVPHLLKGTTETTYDLFEPHVLCPSFVKRNHRNNLRYFGKKCCSALSSLKGTPGTETTYDLFVVRFPVLICQNNNRNNLRCVKTTSV